MGAADMIYSGHTVGIVGSTYVICKVIAHTKISNACFWKYLTLAVCALLALGATVSMVITRTHYSLDIALAAALFYLVVQLPPLRRLGESLTHYFTAGQEIWTIETCADGQDAE